MSRYEETADVCEKVNKNLIALFDDVELTTDEIFAAQKSGIINILSEIALSLAAIADRLEEDL